MSKYYGNYVAEPSKLFTTQHPQYRQGNMDNVDDIGGRKIVGLGTKRQVNPCDPNYNLPEPPQPPENPEPFKYEPNDKVQLIEGAQPKPAFYNPNLKRAPARAEEQYIEPVEVDVVKRDQMVRNSNMMDVDDINAKDKHHGVRVRQQDVNGCTVYGWQQAQQEVSPKDPSKFVNRDFYQHNYAMRTDDIIGQDLDQRKRDRKFGNVVEVRDLNKCDDINCKKWKRTENTDDARRKFEQGEKGYTPSSFVQGQNLALHKQLEQQPDRFDALKQTGYVQVVQKQTKINQSVVPPRDEVYQNTAMLGTAQNTVQDNVKLHRGVGKFW